MDIPFFKGPIPYADWNFTMAAQRNGGCPLGPEGRCLCSRAKVMGGCTVHNFMAYVRGNRRDYDSWAAAGNEGWRYESLLPYFKKSENVQIPELRGSPYHGTKGNLMNSYPYETVLTNYSMEAARLLGIPEVDYNGENQTGISRIQTTTYKGTRWSANRGYLLGLDRPNLFVRKYALVVKIIIENGTAVGVDYVRNNKTFRVFSRKEIILSAGSINSPQLLMLSGIGRKAHLEELAIPSIVDSPVGRTLFDHVMFLGLVIQVDVHLSPSRFEILSDFSNYVRYILNHEGPLSGFSAEALQFFEEKYSPKQ
ncbi:Glucose dehydrogenase [FAD, quinone] [Gryllus bimaculatus]|nr:Glucose dehydrogenase [FAD, quinone] [Gryllus bimaculatus]